MPLQISETTWWLLLGVLLGLFLFWLIDKLYRRDGDYAAQRERRELSSLKHQTTELREENTTSQQRLTERSAEVKRLNTLSEEMRDSIRGKEQQVTNLETALAASREQQSDLEPLRAQVTQLNEKKTELELEVQKSKEAQQTLTQLETDVKAKEQRISDLTSQLGSTTQSYEKTLEELRTEHARLLSSKDGELSDLKTALARTKTNDSTPSTGIAAAATGAAAATIASVTGAATNKDNTPTIEPKTDTKDAPVSQEPIAKPAASSTSGLASRHRDNAAPSKPETDDDTDQPGLLDRLRGAFSGRRPDDLD